MTNYSPSGAAIPRHIIIRRDTWRTGLPMAHSGSSIPAPDLLSLERKPLGSNAPAVRTHSLRRIGRSRTKRISLTRQRSNMTFRETLDQHLDAIRKRDLTGL